VGYFPSFTAGWIISDEGFYGESKLVNFMKLRGSYGTLGMIKFLMVMFLNFGEATYVFDGTLVNGTANGQIPNQI
jgi:hypothetical protein